MQEGRASQSAYGTAALRADHLLYDEDPVFADTHALAMLNAEMRAGVESGGFRKVLERDELRPTQGHILARARVVEDELVKALQQGFDQYVVLGAGFDTFLVRWPEYARAGGLSLYEVDFPATQREKREQLRRSGLAAVPEVEFVPIDFERETLPAALGRSSFDASRRAFYSWLGVVTYLTWDAIAATLTGIREASARGSEVIFDFPIDPSELDARTQEIARAKTRALSEGGEQRQGTFAPRDLQERLADLGFDLVSHLSARDLDERYFRGRQDGLRANPENAVAHFRTV